MARTNLAQVTSVLFQATKNGTQAVVSSAKITGLTVIKDTLNNWNASLNRFDVTVAGSYIITIQLQYSGNQTAGVAAFKVNNGTSYFLGTNSSGDRAGGTVQIPVSLGIGDYVEFYAQPNTSLTLNAGVTDTWFAIAKVA